MNHYQHLFPVYPSVYTGRPTRVILTTRSSDKVGNAVGIIVMDEEVRLSILSTGKARYPGTAWYHAHKPGQIGLKTACGSCPLGDKGKCYVQSNVQNASQPGAAIFDEEFTAGVRRALFKSQWVRSAIAGDMGAVPAEAFLMVKAFVDDASPQIKWLGYTHNPDATHLQGTHVLSAEDALPESFIIASGWRTFNAISPSSIKDGALRLAKGEFLCPASAEAYNVRRSKFSCEDCGACTGTDRLSTSSPRAVIVRHGRGDFQQIKKLGGLRVLDWRGRLVGQRG